jgi:hypothetical protein
VLRLSRRALLSRLASGLLAAAALDLGYDLAALLVLRLTGRSLYFPVLFPLALLVFSALAVRRARPARLCRELDEAFGLKERLGAADRYRRDRSIAPEVVAAQAAETLARVDPQRLARHLAFRPRVAGPLLLLVAAAWVGVRLVSPEWFLPPRSVLYRGGGALVSRIWRHPAVPAPTGGAGGKRARPLVASLPPEQREAANPSTQALPGTPSPALVPTGTAPRAAGQAATAPPSTPLPARAAPPAAPPPDPAARAGAPGKAGKGQPDPRQGSRAGGLPQKSTSIEVGTAVAPLGVRPDSGLVPPMADLKGGAGSAPLPLFRVLGQGAADGLFDPDTLYVQPETFSPRYRDHLIRYFEKLQQLGERSHGS